MAQAMTWKAMLDEPPSVEFRWPVREGRKNLRAFDPTFIFEQRLHEAL